ncbi:MAG: 2-succinyl-5-enolpyruvyl-6-hydroxy-3-cyclohexene-1-carboxylic-acid synthase [Crocinitomicaceae bacterium]|nr:2-succinyl-5-enolpyruvyl-6-hydroxy-3-cyclohexene-1-carboxylic-acid synthase [Crocinitomicaceae bacterium]MDP4723564.1 2-succinyl-5-enolpyruvyl-6-hydroxy-3-cyclohexene-1-carboxylic-acid synthase [Crocinitomicaceae bacterium]MDP4738834.1 2-succinyl-5-enolpyruvyl-6-hydroxy-3-cyclohexene-1-carboxylic-acid synthase [Crocinitomicaceae bacterium]MDP4799058.1 2-succinyl-5-enolpyruvyl-6-hydroxy-3-cyclohexene-1-carboxylic-acid synthase [Crocinitomicaceae bacterium]MDP4805829.1 2-succinyl-5-enolpyruvyl
MQSSDKELVQFVVAALAYHGIQKVVLSPGSRNASFAIAFDAHPQIETIVVHDERAAAFIALGWAEQTQTPVAICCTSGSACLNYYPALAEAYYRNIPILALTADRPSKWINQGDGQTIVQAEVFKNHTHAYLAFDEDTFEFNTHSTQQISAFLSHLSQAWKGPIHLNIGLNEPLYGLAAMQAFEFERQQPQATNPDLPDFKHIEGKKIMVLVGQMDPNPRLAYLLAQFAELSNVVVLVENTSNLKNELFNHCIDRSLNGFEQNDPAFQPEVLISFGGAIVSKRIKAYLRQTPLDIHWRIAPDFPEMNTFGTLSANLPMEPTQFIEALLRSNLSLQTNNYKGKWKAIDYIAKDKQVAFVTSQTTLFDYDIFNSLQERIESPLHLHLANSSVVRYAQLFDPLPNVVYHSNRGTSGIDGSVSTAVGAALASPSEQHLLICGDTSFIYDSNALWTSPFPQNLKIILIQNHGGGIFQIIPGPANSPLRAQYFEATHQKSPGKIAEGYGFEVQYLSDKSKLDATISTFLALTEGLQILEITTAQNQNAQVLQDFFNFVKK